MGNFNMPKLTNRKWILVLAGTLGTIGAAAAQDQVQECQTGAPVVAKMNHDTGENLTCLDSVSADGKIRALVLSTKTETTASGGRSETNVAIVVAGVLSADGKTVDQIDSQTPLADPSLFPNSCGEYLKGGLVLPGSAKIALVYAQKIRTVDYSDPAKLVIAIVNDQSIPGMASTCEGYTPNWRGGRQNITVDGSGHTLSLEITARQEVEQPESKKISGQAEHHFYERAYSLECGSGSASLECKDLKRARDQGIFIIRHLVRPVQTIVVKY